MPNVVYYKFPASSRPIPLPFESMPTLWDVILGVLNESIKTGKVKMDGRDFDLKVVAEGTNVEYKEMGT
eukprot:CAMPEP_0118662224 /NCGR_PEP_ID=MMETSP0785-20121206/16707_1 /TAXON_ID=91992 /ORGANISM="Bolidomonas pacifica, Strain CCMP 1866" /LENGTH=68 /DNA_ID=CAMNT_0006555733 /DNA_START=184 /DNA_END=387 /DNA_ORIENTATION=+